MVNITRALERVKQGLGTMVGCAAVNEICREVGYSWRDRLMDPWTTIHLFILQIAYGNTACSHLPHIVGEQFTASAYCQARRRLPLEVFGKLVAKVGAGLQARAGSVGLWRGHRTVMPDGSSFSMPDTPELQARFGQPGAQKKGCGFPVAHLLTAFDAGTGLILDTIAAPLRTHDMANVHRMIPYLRENDVVVADRGFCSYAHFALLLQAAMHGCFRMHQRRIVDFGGGGKGGNGRRGPSRRLKTLGPRDQVVEWPKPQKAPGWMDKSDFASLPESIQIRALAFRIVQRGFRTRQITLATTLLDEDTYPAEELAALYRTRWQAEINLRHLKTTMGLEVLKCKTVQGVLKELWIYVLVYNLVCMVMLEAARRQNVAARRISFNDALRWLAHAPSDPTLPALVINPDRPNRIEPRVIKRRMKKYTLMNKPRKKLRQDLIRKEHAA
jgi:hypothetical protein